MIISLAKKNFIFIALKNELLIQPTKNDVPYNFSKSLQDVDVSGQGQPQTINKEIFKDLIQDGFYIEAGAFDGELRSNSLFFELEKGWNGLLVEPNPDAFQELLSKVKWYQYIKKHFNLHQYFQFLDRIEEHIYSVIAYLQSMLLNKSNLM